MPVWRGLLERWPNAVLRASEDAVGLPPGQMGNSEVGHLNLGAGQPVLQDLPADRRRDRGRQLLRPPGAPRGMPACRGRRTGGSTSSASIGPGGVHANDRHLVALVELARPRGRRGTSGSTRCSTAATRRRARRSGFVADLERGSAAAHPGRADRVGRRALLGDGPRHALGADGARLRRDRPRRGTARAVGGRRDRGGVRPRRDRRVRRADGHRRRRRPRPRRRRRSSTPTSAPTARGS